MNEKSPIEDLNAEDVSKVLQTIIANNHETMLAFNDAMSKREALSIRIGKRTTQILRFGIMSILLISALMFFLIQSLSKHIDTMASNITHISATMGNMDKSFSAVTQTLNHIDNTMGGLNSHIEAMRRDIHSVPQMTKTMQVLQENVADMDTSIVNMTGDMRALNQNTSGINQQFAILIQQMRMMTHDVNRMSAPMKMFPF
ncbi:MAG: hypothetical protein DSZ29_05590 [Aquificaceae bacterium]|nr:MAG: hypothetical protein DSZ29_05590 [Aquificaceae bacterium]